MPTTYDSIDAWHEAHRGRIWTGIDHHVWAQKVVDTYVRIERHNRAQGAGWFPPVGDRDWDKTAKLLKAASLLTFVRTGERRGWWADRQLATMEQR